MYKRSLFIFRRDLRLEDNVGLNQALSQSSEVVPAFIFDPRQTQPHEYRSVPGLWFLKDSLHSLDAELAALGSGLKSYSGIAHTLVSRWASDEGIEAIWVNRDYTPFSRKRDEAIRSECLKHGIAFHSCDDALINPPEGVLKSNGQPYTVFTPYFNRASQAPVATPIALEPNLAGGFSKSIPEDNLRQPLRALVQDIDTYADIRGGREAAQNALSKTSRLADYAAERDFPALESTSALSPHLKFGTCSVREAYWTVANQLGSGHPLIRQFYWRDFLTQIAFHFPRVFGNAFKTQYEGVAWSHDPSRFSLWQNGSTGFPIVDAGMRQLNETGFMHNRLRMITASFLTKDLHIDWKWGERYFAQKLMDYDPCVNNGNWQWAASTGCDAQPYFRIFNPWRQQERFDPDCAYIKRWIPELRDVAPKQIHNWQGDLGIDYPAPALDHKRASAKAKMLFQA